MNVAKAVAVSIILLMGITIVLAVNSHNTNKPMVQPDMLCKGGCLPMDPSDAPCTNESCLDGPAMCLPYHVNELVKVN